MSEEEIIKQTEIYINLLIEARKYGTATIEQIRFQEVLEGLLDLFQKEKEKNKEVEKFINNNELTYNCNFMDDGVGNLFKKILDIIQEKK